MSTHFKAGQLVVAPTLSSDRASIRVNHEDLIFECVDKNTGEAIKCISLSDLLNRIDSLEKALAEFILIGEKKNG